MARSSFTISTGVLARMEARVDRLAGRLDVLAARARSTLVRRLPVAAVRDIGEEYNLAASRIRKDVSAKPFGADGIELRAKRRAVGLIEFGAKWAGRGSHVTVQIRRAGPRVAYSSAFIAAGLRGAAYLGNRHIFERDALKAKRIMRKGNYIGQLKQPIRALYGPRVGDMLADTARRDRLTAFAHAVIRAEIDRLLR